MKTSPECRKHSHRVLFFFYYNFVYFKSQRLLIKQVSQVVFFIISYSRETYEKSKTVEKSTQQVKFSLKVKQTFMECFVR